jgi:hypothetical protein
MAFKISKILLLSILLFSCTTNGKDKKDSNNSASSNKLGKQLNISVLWDLSDRIDPKSHKENPSHEDRDIAIIKYLADYFKSDMATKGAYLAKSKLKVFFSPHPTDANINNLASKLDIDLSNKDAKEKKKIYDNISYNFEQASKQITELTIQSSNWPGSDVYRFFKNDVVDYCVSKDTDYRNILVILTDGYLYHKDSKQRIANKSEYILPSLLSSLRLRDNPNYKTVFETKKCGLISTRQDLNNLEVLVLEVNSEVNHKDDEYVIKLYLQKWFTEMKTKRYKIFNTDLPDNTKKRINDFLSN